MPAARDAKVTARMKLSIKIPGLLVVAKFGARKSGRRILSASR
jgi:hypothetical protein